MSTRRQVGRFVIVGVGATISDAITYSTLLATVLPGRFDLAKGASFVIGTLVSYALNKHWTFERPERDHREAGAFFALYGFSMGLNVGVNRLSLEGLAAAGLAAAWAAPIAFVLATGASTVSNFVGQKFWVFRDR